MMEDLRDAVTECSELYTITRHVSVGVYKGQKVDPRTEEVEMDLAVTPITGKDVRRLADGQALEGSLLVICTEELFTARSSTCKLADVFTWIDGARYEISMVNNWTRQGGFYECTATRLEG